MLLELQQEHRTCIINLVTEKYTIITAEIISQSVPVGPCSLLSTFSLNVFTLLLLQWKMYSKMSTHKVS